MPPTGYLTTSGIESCLIYLRSAHPSRCQLIDLPELSREGRSMRAIRIAGGPRRERPGVVFIGGCHAREIVNPDLLVTFAFRLLSAYATNSGISFGPKTYDAIEVKLVVDNLDLFIFPLINPDGRSYVQTPAPVGDPWWRKNRNPNPGLPCKGVDVNRNYDFLWSSGIGTSSNSCSETYKGTSPFSEPESRNVRYLLDGSDVRYFVDVHSYTELILYPWGDDDNQTSDPSMAFTNPAFDGVRGLPGDAAYREYIRPNDELQYVRTANRVRDAIAAVRGRSYTAKQGVGLYPTSGTSLDYAYSRHFVDATRPGIQGYLLETGTEFQPTFSEAAKVISEVSAGLFEFLLTCVCPVETVSAMRVNTVAAAQDIDAVDDELEYVETVADFETVDGDHEDLRAFSDFEMGESPAGRLYTGWLDDHAVELLRIVADDADLRERVVGMLDRVGDVVRSRNDREPGVFSDDIIGEVAAIADTVGGRASEPLRASMEQGRGELDYFRNRSVVEALARASEAVLETGE